MPQSVRVAGHSVVLFALFFILSMGLGYPTLSRYDPTESSGTVDAKTYVDIVERGPRGADTSHRRFRVLVPFLARPIRDVVDGWVESWNSTLFALLIVNAVFCAAACVLLVYLAGSIVAGGQVAGGQVAGRLASGGLVAGLLLLLNPVVANFHLAGLTDSAELFGLVLLTWLLHRRQWSWIPICGVLCLAKETFVVMGCAYVLAWYLATWRKEGFRPMAVGAMAGLGFVGVVSITLVRRSIEGYWIWPWEIADSLQVAPSLIEGIVAQLSHKLPYLTLAWLLVLALPRLFAISTPWLVAALGSSAVVVYLGAGAGAGGNIARPLYATLGPLLCVAVAQLLVRWESQPTTVTEPDGESTS